METTTERLSPLARKAYSIEETIRIFGFNRNRIYALINEGRLRTFKHGRRRYVSAEALDRCIRDLEASTEQAGS